MGVIGGSVVMVCVLAAMVWFLVRYGPKYQ